MAPCSTPPPRFRKPIWRPCSARTRQGLRSSWSPAAVTASPFPVAESLGFDLWIISSNGAVTRSTRGESFHRDLMPRSTAMKICRHMPEFHNHLVITFDREGMGAIVCENHQQLYGVIQRWMEKNAPYIEYVNPIEKALTEDPIQTMFCGPIAMMESAKRQLLESDFTDEITILQTKYDHRDLTIVDILNAGCSKGHALERWATLPRHRPFRSDGYRRQLQ